MAMHFMTCFVFHSFNFHVVNCFLFCLVIVPEVTFGVLSFRVGILDYISFSMAVVIR